MTVFKNIKLGHYFLVIAGLIAAAAAWFVYQRNDVGPEVAKKAEVVATTEQIAAVAPPVTNKARKAEIAMRSLPSTEGRRASSATGPERLTQPLAEVYEQLLGQANKGNARAALDMHMALHDCNWSSSKEGRAIINRDYSTIPEHPSKRKTVPLRSRADVMAEDLATMELFQKINKGCEGVPDDLKKRELEFLVRSADQGDIYAQRLYGNRGYPGDDASDSELSDYEERTWRYLQAAAKSCSPDAVSGLASAYYARRDDDLQNRMHAYAYALVSDRARNTSDGEARHYSANVSEDEKRRAASVASSFYSSYCSGR